MFLKGTEALRHIELNSSKVSRYAIIVGDPGRVEILGQLLSDFEIIQSIREFRIGYGSYNGLPITIASTGVGCPSTAICVEDLILSGVDTIVRVGTSGGLSEQVKLRDLVIATGAVREEGTSIQYVPLAYPAVADYQLVHSLVEAASEFGHPFHVGIVHSKDAIYIEVPETIPDMEEQQRLLKVWTRANVLATDMESSLLFSLGTIRGIRTSSILSVIGYTWDDEPFSGVESTVIEAATIVLNGFLKLSKIDEK